jgi:predicted membrane protein DUF2157
LNPDVAGAIPTLVDRGLLSAEVARRLLRVARGDLVSVHAELRLLLYLGVLLVSSGVGLLVKDNLARIGPVTIALGIGLAAAMALGWVVRSAPAFSWEEVASPSLAFDCLLLLGILLVGADLAFIEVKFTALGEHWPWHLLIVALLAGAAAIRFDSRAVFSLALSSFAAWRGVSASILERSFWSAHVDSVRWNAVGCGVLFVLTGFLLKQARHKAHFEPVAVHLGWLLVLGALASGALDGPHGVGLSVLLLLTGSALAAGAFRARRFPLLGYGVLAAYVGTSRLAIELLGLRDRDVLAYAWFFATSLAVVAGLLAAHRKMKEEAP